jgi:hypothetical protein
MQEDELVSALLRTKLGAEVPFDDYFVRSELIARNSQKHLGRIADAEQALQLVARASFKSFD